MAFFVDPPVGQPKESLVAIFAEVGIANYKISYTQNTSTVRETISKDQELQLHSKGCKVHGDVQLSTFS